MLGGHKNTIAANYGSGYALDKLREHMSRVWETWFSQDIKTMETARAFNPFLVAKSDKLKKLIEEVQQQIEGYEAYH